MLQPELSMSLQGQSYFDTTKKSASRINDDRNYHIGIDLKSLYYKTRVFLFNVT